MDDSINNGLVALNQYSPGTWTLVSVTGVQEPSTLFLLGTSLLGLVGFSLKRLVAWARLVGLGQDDEHSALPVRQC